MAQIDGGELVVRMLEREGVSHVFTLHGGHVDAIYQAALDHGLCLIDTRHEQAAGHAADGWARTTGRPGVAVVTAGPGVTDVVSAVANAYLDCVPMLVIGGRSPLAEDETLPLQGGFSQTDLLRPITKWSRTVTHPQRIPDFLAQAFREATSGRPGPVFLEIPSDVLFASVEEEAVPLPEAYRPQEPPAPRPEAVEQAIEWLLAAERPVVMAGSGVWYAGAAQELAEFAEATGIPVVANTKARGCLSEDHPLCAAGFPTLLGTRRLGGPDVVLLLGARLGLLTGGHQWPFIPASAKVIQVDIAGEEIGRNRAIQLGVVADCREMLRALIAAARPDGRPQTGARRGPSGRERSWPNRSGWVDALQGARGALRAASEQAAASDARPIHPYRLALDAARFLEGMDAVIVADGGETAFWMEMASTIRQGGHWLSHGYLGCLGTGLPFAIAAQLAHPEKRVFCITGDGAIGLNFAEFDTMVRHDLPIVCVVNNDQAWGMSKHGQQLTYGEKGVVVTELGPVRYDLAAQGFGCYGELVEDPKEIVPALERAFASGRPACLNVMTDPSVIAPVTLAMARSGVAG